MINRDTVYLVVYTKTQPLPHYTAVLRLQERDILEGRWARRKIVDSRREGEHIVLRRSRD